MMIANWKFSSGFGGKLATSMFSDLRLAIRETLSNRLDAETEIDAPMKFEIKLDYEKRTITFEDWGAGLTQNNLKRFLEQGVDNDNNRKIGPVDCKNARENTRPDL